MDSIYFLIPVTTVLLGLAVAAYLWSVSSGQFEDLDKAARSILFEDAEQAPDASGPDASAPPPAAPEDEAR